MSLFISFEGGEGTGKSTQAKILNERLQQAGISPLLIHEPGTTPLGKYLRNWLKREQRKGDTISHGAETFLFAAARAELVAKVLKSALSRPSAVIIADRFSDSTLGYQGYGRRIRLEQVKVVNELATQGIVPDLTFLLDIEPETGLMRVGSVQIRLPLESHGKPHARRIDEEGTRRFEEEPLEFHRRVHQGYLAMAKAEPLRWCVIDATKPVEEIRDIVWQRVEPLLSDEIRASANDTPNLNWTPRQ